MQTDAIFRFYLNSKVYGSALALDLQARKKLSLEDEVSQCIKSFERDCNTLREKLAKPEIYFTSSHIVGSSLLLEDFCDIIVRAGVLCTEPSNPSYGHGATVMGRIIEEIQNTKISDYISDTILKPCKMEAQFFFEDNDPRVSRLPSMVSPVRDKGETDYSMVATQETVPASTNHTDHYAGPRKCESLDTGLCMDVESYAKFFDILLNKGLSPEGHRVLDESAVYSLTHDETPLGPFSYGWEVKPYNITTSKGTRTTMVCHWLGYATTLVYCSQKS